MIYSATITTTHGATELTATETKLIINKGLIWMIEVEYPWGCCGFVHVQIFDCNYQLFPATPGEYLKGDGILAKYDDLYFKGSAPYELIIKTWNEDETYDHTIQVRIGLATLEAYMSRYIPSMTWDKLAEMIAQIETTQEAEKERAIQTLQEEIGIEDQTSEGGE